MYHRFVRGAVRSAAVAAAVTGALAWAPAATAQPSEPTPSASAAPAETQVPDGSVAIIAKDPAGDVLPGAGFLLLDSAGQEAGRGKTDAQGKLTRNPTGTPSTRADKPGSGPGAGPSASGSSMPNADSSYIADVAVDDKTPKEPAGSLAHTGADATPWTAAGAGLLVVGGVATLVVARRRTADGFEPEDSGTVRY